MQISGHGFNPRPGRKTESVRSYIHIFCVFILKYSKTHLKILIVYEKTDGIQKMKTEVTVESFHCLVSSFDVFF